MTDPGAAAIDRILGFCGYGNPSGTWFAGKEEGLAGMDPEDQDANLVARGRFGPVMDLNDAHMTLRVRGHAFDLATHRPLTQAWTWAAQFARALEGADDWRDLCQARHYARTRLGRSGGRTFLANLSPIPARGGGDAASWRAWFRARAAPGMFDLRLAERHRALRSMISAFRPPVVICHGGPRPRHRSLMLGHPEYPGEPPRIEAHELPGGTHLFLCPFFGMGQLRVTDAHGLVSAFRERKLIPS